MSALIKKSIALFLGLMMPVCLLSADIARAGSSGSFSKSHDGGSGLEIGIGSDSMIVLEGEDILISFEKDGSDELNAVAESEYILTNSDSKRAYACIAVVRLLKVEAVGIPGADEELFVSGETITVGDKEVNGFIYPIDTPEKTVKKSAYDTFSDALFHMSFSGYFDEAFARYGVTSRADHEKRLGEGLDGVPKRVEKQMWRQSDKGEEKLCVVTCNLSFEPGESKTVRNTQKIRASMTRPTGISDEGTVFSFKYNGENLKSFYNVKSIKAVIDFKDSALADSFKSDAPFYSDDGKPTLRFSNGDFSFEFSVGKKLGKDEIYDIYAGKGHVKKLLDIGAVAVTFIVLVSAVFIVYSVRKRKKSGIGLSL